LRMQDGKTHSTQPARTVLQKQDNQSQWKFAFDRLGPNGSNNRGSREDQHQSNRVEQPRDNRSRPPVPVAPRNHSHHVDWREGGAESEYRKARVPDRFPYFANQLLLVWLPYKFKPSNNTKYDGKIEPKQWLRIYSQSIELVGGDDGIKALFFPMVLEAMPL
jgi:hypothetical protein